LLNGERLFNEGPSTFVPPQGQLAFRDYPEAPVFLSDLKLGRTDRDFEGYSGYWLISDRMKSALEATDSEAFAFLRCDMRSPDDLERPVRWLCDVVRILDALDEQRSAARIGVADDGSKVYLILGRERLIFKESVVGESHIFRMKYRNSLIICDEEMRRACKSAGLTGISFYPTE
jgi:hypothetical protein